MKKFLLVILLFESGMAQADVSALVRKIQKQYESIKSLEADFTQIRRSQRFGEEKFTGHAWIEKPGKMRWDYDQPKGKCVVSDGKEVILFDPGDQQAIVSTISGDQDLPPPFSFLWGKGDLNKDFHVVENKAENALEAVPRHEIPNVSKVLLWVSPGPLPLIEKTRVYFIFGEENEIALKNIQVNPKITAQRFKLKLPKGTVLVSADTNKK